MTLRDKSSKAKILLVDDERSIRVTLGELLKDEGFDISVAEDANSALEILSKVDIDVVVTDIIMPRITGVKLLETIQKTNPEVQVILMTGEPTVKTASEAVRSGAFNYLTKPIRIEDMIKTVTNAVKIKKIDDERRRLLVENIEYQENLEKLVKERTEDLFESAELNRSITNTAVDAIISIDSDGLVLSWNKAAEKIFGYAASKMMKSDLSLIIPSHSLDDHRTGISRINNGHPDKIIGKTVEITALRENGMEFPIELSLSSWEAKGKKHYTGIIRDITVRNRAEKLLKALNQAAVVMGSALTLEEIFNSVAEQLDHLDISCLLYTLDKSNEKLDTKFMSFDSVLLNNILKLSGLKESEFSFSYENVDIYREVINNKISLYTDISQKVIEQVLPKFAKKFSAEISEMLNAKTGIFTPLIINNEVFGVFSLQSNTLTKEDIPAATAFSYQLADAWEKTALIKNLQKTLTGTIDTIAAMVEARDPYTAGHQGRVSAIAVSIATEMGLSKEKIEGIRLASLVHDLGKINVPAEILSKPGKISALEFEIIKTHPQVGYDLLKNTEFLWPIAKTILQHHENMDGSGYPNGLKADEILIEARILIVADVVEATSSHRPYRPAHGIDFALEEIGKGRGTLFDPDVVDACLKIFKQGYKIPED